MSEEVHERIEVKELWSKLRDLVFKGRSIEQRTMALRDRVEQTKAVERFVS